MENSFSLRKLGGDIKLEKLEGKLSAYQYSKLDKHKDMSLTTAEQVNPTRLTRTFSLSEKA